MKRLLPLLLPAFLMTGCASYYKITETKNNRVYYTTSYSSKKSGAITFKDAATGAKVTLLEHSMQKIDKEEFENNVNPKGTTKKGW